MILLIVKEWKEGIKNKRVLLFFAGLLLIIGIVYFSGKTKETSGSSITIGILDEDESFYSRLLVNYFKEDKNFSSYAQLITASENELEEQFAAGKINAYLILPKNFAKNLIQIENTPIDVKISTADTTIAVLLKNVLEGYGKFITAVEVNAVALYEQMERDGMEQALMEQMNIEISKNLVITALGRKDFFQQQVEKNLSSTPLTEYYSYVLVGMLLLYMGLIPGLRLLKEKKSQVFDRGRAAGISIWAYIGSKLLVYGILSILSGMLLFGGISGKTGLNFTAVRFLVLMGMSGISLLLGMLPVFWVKNERAYMIGINMFYVIIAAVGGALIPVMYLPESFLMLSRLTPIYWFVRLMAL